MARMFHMIASGFCFFIHWQCSATQVSVEDPLANQTNVIAFKQALTESLLAHRYDVATAPEYPRKTHVNFTIWPEALRYVNERDETILVQSWIQVKWYDKRLRLTIRNRTGDAFCAAPAKMSVDQIWTPVLLLDQQTFRMQTPFPYKPYITVDCQGNVELRARSLDETFCKLQMRYFPFDQQNCGFTVHSEPDVHLHNEIYYKELRKTVEIIRRDVEDYDSGSWKLYASEDVINLTFYQVGSFVSQPGDGYGDYSSLFYNFYLTRKPMQYVLDWVVPPILLGVTGIITMFVGCDASERHAFGGTTVVTLTLMLSSLREHMAVAIDGYPILAQLYMGFMASTIAATMFATLPHRVAKRLPTNQAYLVSHGPQSDQQAHGKIKFGKKCTFIMTEKQLDVVAMTTFLLIQSILVTYASICWYERKIV